MYRSSLRVRDKSGAIVAVVAIHALLLFLLFNLSGRIDLPGAQSALRVFDLSDVPPPRPPPPQQRAVPKPTRSADGSAPANIRSQATPVANPPPVVPLPLPLPTTATNTPAEGAAPTQGAAAAAGPGTGAGGQGNGNGSGTGTGSGSGSGNGGAVTSPQLVTPVLRGRDFPRELLDAWPRRAPVFLRLRVDPQGYVAECIVDRGTGVAAIDSEMCNLAHQRLRFRPALDRSGQPVAGWFGYGQTAPR